MYSPGSALLMQGKTMLPFLCSILFLGDCVSVDSGISVDMDDLFGI